MKKRVLCYGDSNLWGSIASNKETQACAKRYKDRWTTELQKLLGNDFVIIEEGLSGRSTIYQAEGEEYKNGETYLLPCLLSHAPLDLIIFMLGSNDLKTVFNVKDEDLDLGISRIIDIVRENPCCGDYEQEIAPKILIISPSPVKYPNGRQDYFKARGSEEAIRKSKLFHNLYKEVARKKEVFFVDAAQHVEIDLADGLHFTQKDHFALSAILAEKVKSIFNV